MEKRGCLPPAWEIRGRHALDAPQVRLYGDEPETNLGRAGDEGGATEKRLCPGQWERGQYLMSICCMKVRYSPGVLPFFLRKILIKLDWLLKPQL